MKTLVNFIKESKLPRITKYPRIIPPNKQASEYSFEEYCNDLINEYNIHDDIDSLWEGYIENKWFPLSEIEYKGYTFDEYFYEMEMYVYSSNEVFEYIEKHFIDYFTAYDKIDNKYSNFAYFMFYGNLQNLNKIIENNEYVKFMNFANWSSYLTKDSKGRNCILVKPNKTEIITDKVYSYDYIYHYCPKFIYDDKISKYGLNPKHKFGSKYEKLYCFWSNNPVEDMKQWARLKLRTTDNIYKKEKIKKDNFIILKIDLNKCKEKIRFYKDEESNSEHTFYTFEPIPPFAIIDIINMDIKI